MSNPHLAALASAIATLTALSACAGQQRKAAMQNIATPTTLEEVKSFAQGTWKSISIELRPTEDRTGSGAIAPTRLTREFTYLPGDKFTGVITMFADDYGKAPLMAFEFRGTLRWGNPHPIANGAFEIDYVLDDGFALTPLHDQAAAMLNQVPVPGLQPFATGTKQDLLGKAFPLFNISAGQIVTDYDLIYFHNGMLFMGAKHVDGTPFDKPDRRPHQLQIPLARAN